MAPAPSNPAMAKRQRPAFKPPRPVNNQGQTTAAGKRTSGATTSRTAAGAASKKTASTKGKRAAPVFIESSDAEEIDEDDLSIPDIDDQMEDVTTDEDQTEERMEPIPERLLGRLLQEGFEDDNTKIHRGAMELTAKYMELFVREAISRAVVERKEATKRGGVTDGFLQVEDLEKLTPQLVLDF